MAPDTDEVWSSRRSLSRWAVFDGYEVRDGVVIASGPHQLYYPMTRPRLPFELAKVKPWDEKGALAFVSEFGLLGYRELALAEGASAEKPEAAGDPLEFIWGHAFTVRNLLTIDMRLRDGLARALYENPRYQVAAFRGTKPERRCPPPQADMWVGTSRQSHLQFFDGPWQGTEEQLFATRARGTIVHFVNSNLSGVRPDLQPSQLNLHTLLDPRRRFVLGFSADPMMAAIYWHLAVHLTNSDIAVCKECGNFFERRDPRRQFCPAPEGWSSTGKRGPQSLCGNRYHVRRSRQSGSKRQQQ